MRSSPLSPAPPARLLSRLPYLFPAFLALVTALPLEATYDERAQQVLENLASFEVPSPGGTGKLPYGRAIAHLALTDGESEAARAYLAGSGYGGEIFFNSIQQVRALYMAQEHLTPDQLAAIRAQATSSSNNWNNNGTENHRKMTWSSGYLLAQFFPDAEWRYGNETLDSPTLMRRLKERLATVGHNEYRAGYSEFLSPNYEIWHVSPMINLLDYAEDPEVRALAEASLLQHLTLIALGSYEEVVLPPWSRYAGVQNRDATGARIQLLTWLFWGHGNIPASRDFSSSTPLSFFAVTDWRPPEILDLIAQREVDYPYTARMQQTHFGWGTERYVMRTTYQDELYAISSGVFRFKPGAFQLDDSQFAIAWDGGAQVRQIHAYHPYWRQLVDDMSDWLRPTSPFMQTGHHENSVIMLFDIPAEDPWAGRGNWAGEREGPMVPLAQLRFPSHMNYTAGADDWFFVTDGPVYIGIKVLKEGWTRDRRALSGYNVIKSEGTDGERWQTGFIYEVGTEAEFGTPEAFKAAVEANPVSIDWETMTVTYTNTGGDELNFQYSPFVDGSINEWIPDFAVNDEAIIYDESWPTLESPWTSLRNNLFLLKLSDNETLVTDWRGDIPTIETVEGSLEPPTIAEPPVDSTVEAGGSVTLSVEASGTEPLSFQWYRDGAIIEGATEASLTFNGIASADAGLYTVEIRNSYGTVSSESVTLTVEEESQPETWAGYPIDENGYVNTEGFLGWIYPDGEFVLVFLFDKWIYLPESFVTEQGAWSYIP